MRLVIIEGTPTEIAAVPQLRELLASSEGMQRVGNGAEPTHDQVTSEDEASSPVTADLIKRAILRKPLSPAQRAIFQTLYRAGDGWASLAQLEELPEVGRGGCPGVFGGIGLRFEKTRGWPRNAGRARDLVFEVERREDGRWYRLRLVTRRGLELAGVMQ